MAYFKHFAVGEQLIILILFPKKTWCPAQREFKMEQYEIRMYNRRARQLYLRTGFIRELVLMLKFL